jgi:hypothetical protein
MLVVIGPQNLRIGTHLSPNRGRQDGPALLSLSSTERRDVYHYSIALLHLGQFSFRRPSPACPLLPLAACLDAVAEGMIPPELWPAPPASRGPAFIDSHGGLRVGGTRIQLRSNALPMRFHLRRFLGLGRGRRLGFLLREGAGMHDEKP